MNRIVLNKMDVARRQLETAISMYFNCGDPVSTHTLAAAAYEVLCHLNETRGGTPMVLDLRASTVIKPGKLKEARNMFRCAQNFFKHADIDPNASLDFNPEATVFYLFDAVEKYRELTKENPPSMRVLALWFRVQWASVFHFPENENSILANARKHFRLKDKEKFWSVILPLYQAQATKIVAKSRLGR